MRDQNGLRRLFAGILLIVIIHEWMRPLSALSSWTDVYSVAPILITIAGLLAVDVLKLAPYWSWTVKLFIILTSVAAMFHGTNLLHLDLWIDFAVMFMEDSLHILTGQWNAISAEGRTVLFITAWGTVVSWLFVVILYQSIAIYATLLTVIYLLTLQMWTNLNTINGILVAIAAGLLLHGLSVLPMLENKYSLKVNHRGWPWSWVVSSVLFVCIIMGSGALLSMGQNRATLKLPSFEWNWQSIEAFIPMSMRYANNQSNMEQKSGYSLNDTRLGGTVSSDNSIAFVATTERPDAYWRGESKAIYDGKSWRNLADNSYVYRIGDFLPNILSDADSSPVHNSSAIIQEVFPFPDYPSDKHATILLSSGAIRRVDYVQAENEMENNSPAHILLDRIEGQITLQGNGSSAVTSYRIQTFEPITSESAKLMLASAINGESVPAEISEPYVQLPALLPERVAQLARTITSELDTTWEKANAIEQYLSSQYRYTLTPNNTAKEGDFVDQFLFETKEGYCDYFSTAMVVMLRTVGIPARWVKGFAPGEIIDAKGNDGLQESLQTLRASNVKSYPVVVRNRDAHSWVEVYISGVGWTSFDPTPASLESTALEPGGISRTDEAIENHTWDEYVSRMIAFVSDTRTLSFVLWIIIMSLCGFVLRFLFKSRGVRALYDVVRIRVAMARYKWGMTTKLADMQLLERILVRAFTRYGLMMHSGETLRELVVRRYFADVDGQSLLEFVSLYESTRYGSNQRKRVSYERIEAAWRLLR